MSEMDMSSVRRSSRANKGHHRRLEEEQKELEEALRRAEEEAEAERLKEEDEHVLCSVCGTTDANYDETTDERDMIQCEKCRTWQHNECLLKDPSIIPDNYRCNVCDLDDPYYKTLECKLDPVMVRKELDEDDKKKARKKSEFLRVLKDFKDEDVAEEDDEGDEVQDGESDVSSSEDSDEAGDDDDDNIDEEAERLRKELKEERRRLKLEKKTAKSSLKRSMSDANDEDSNKSKKPKKTKVTKPTLDHIEEKARQAVRKRFEGMFLNLLPGHTIPNEEGTIEEISDRWAHKLEEDLFEGHHDRATGKLTKDYKEASTRIFVNIRDVKNTKLRNSIIDREIPFNKLVKMTVNELLNPDLRKEKEEAIKESMTQATLEKVKVSNIRRTHKGDIVLENEETQAASQQFDFNVGLPLDDNERKFTDDQPTVERKSVDLGSKDINGMYNPQHFVDEEDIVHNGADEGDGTPQNIELFEDEEDDDLAKILGETSKKLAEVDGYDPTVVQLNSQLWHGQTVFAGVTNFESCLQFNNTTLNPDEFRDIAYSVFDGNLPLEIQGRLDTRKAEDYLLKISTSRKMILLELKNSDNVGNGYKRLWDYLDSKSKYGVLRNTQPFVKDAYILPISTRLPKWFKTFSNLKVEGVADRLYVVLVVRQEMIHDFAKTTQQPLMEYDARASLGPNEMALMQKIFEERPETKNNPTLLVQHLQQLLKNTM